MNIHSPMVLTSAFYTPDETNGVEGFIPIPIFSISQTCSNYQSQFVLTKQGKVFFQGLDYCGMLNDEKKMNFDFWVLVPFSFPIKQIQCGLEIVFLLTYQGQVYTSKYYKKNDSVQHIFLLKFLALSIWNFSSFCSSYYPIVSRFWTVPYNVNRK